jgi:hypothetical protein
MKLKCLENKNIIQNNMDRNRMSCNMTTISSECDFIYNTLNFIEGLNVISLRMNLSISYDF